MPSPNNSPRFLLVGRVDWASLQERVPPANASRMRHSSVLLAALMGALIGVQLASPNLYAAQDSPHQGIDRTRLLAADETPHEWLSHGRNYAETRESPLRHITPANVSRLGLAWYADTNTTRGLEASPLVFDGVIYSTLTWSQVVAHDARTGKQLWQYDPQVPRAWGINACCDVVNRGLAAWGDYLYVGTLDGRLVALNKTDGTVAWETLTVDQTKPYTITGAPRAINGKILIGNGGAEYGVRGYVSAYDAQDGKLLWRFYTVPGDPKQPYESDAMRKAAQTWTGDVYWKTGGGGTVWDSMAYDPNLNLLYIGVGNGSPWNRWIRSPQGGDNLFLASIVALDADSGEYRWHYQTTPAETWDYTATQHMILAELEIRGQQRRVLMQAPKNGFFYVLDRETGELLFADKYVPATWASHVDLESGRPVETPNADHRAQSQQTSPAATGGHNWHPMAFNAGTGLVYIPAMQSFMNYNTDPNYVHKEGQWNLGQEGNVGGPPVPLPDDLMNAVFRKVARGVLMAWDPLTQSERWRVQHPTVWNGGVLTTASGLVFQGTGDGRFVAYDATDGRVLWEAQTGTGIIAPPISFAIEEQQYVAVMAGWGGVGGITLPQAVSANGPGRLLVYALDGEVQLPVSQSRYVFAQPPPAKQGSAESIEAGAALYAEHCGRCHGPNFGAGGAIADLRYMSPSTHELFDKIVLEGLFSGVGMVSFGHILDPQEATSIHDYIIDRAHDAYAAEQDSGWWRTTKHWLYDKAATVTAWILNDE